MLPLIESKIPLALFLRELENDKIPCWAILCNLEIFDKNVGILLNEMLKIFILNGGENLLRDIIQYTRIFSKLKSWIVKFILNNIWHMLRIIKIEANINHTLNKIQNEVFSKKTCSWSSL